MLRLRLSRKVIELMLILPHLYKPKSTYKCRLFRKKQTSGRKKSFSSEWEELYFVTEVGDKIQCLVCQQVKKCNVRRHYETMHREKYDAYAGNIREDQVMKLKSINEISLPMFVSPAKIQQKQVSL